MLIKELTIKNKLGLHARAAAKFVAQASRFTSDIQVRKDQRTVDGKSIMGVMMLAASQGTQLTLSLEGEDEQQAYEAIQDLVDRYFDEGE